MLTFKILLPAVTYVKLETALRLPITFNYSEKIDLRITWTFDGSKVLAVKTGNQEPISQVPERAYIEGQATLVLNKTTLKDNGTYSFSWLGSVFGSRDYTVIVQGNRLFFFHFKGVWKERYNLNDREYREPFVGVVISPVFFGFGRKGIIMRVEELK